MRTMRLLKGAKMYKKDLHRIEDSIFPILLEGLMLCQIKHDPTYAKSYEKPLKILRENYKQNINTPKLLRRAERIEKKVLKHWNANDCVVRKSIMELSYLVAELEKQEALMLQPDIKQIFIEINDIIVSAYDDKDILKQDKSAAKQAPKVLKILQDEGLF
jgi:hypothetical protein